MEDNKKSQKQKEQWKSYVLDKLKEDKKKKERVERWTEETEDDIAPI